MERSGTVARAVFVAMQLPAPDYPQRVGPTEVRVFADERAAREWTRDPDFTRAAGFSGPTRTYQRCQVETAPKNHSESSSSDPRKEPT